MKKIFILLVLLFGIHSTVYAKDYQRIVSLSPSITETIFALGMGDRLVGVTDFCTYPEAALKIKKVGGLQNTNYEVMYSLEPDLIIMLSTEWGNNSAIANMGIDIVKVETKTIPDIIASMKKVGEALDRVEESAAIIERINNDIAFVREKTKDLNKPKVLVLFWRPVGEGVVKEAYIAGNYTYFQDIIEIAGGVNAYSGAHTITSPIVSTEGIMVMDPDIIIDMTPRIGGVAEFPLDVAMKDWDMLSDISAYKNKRIHVVNDSYLGKPGPRFGLILFTIAKLIHPEVNWDQ